MFKLPGYLCSWEASFDSTFLLCHSQIVKFSNFLLSIFSQGRRRRSLMSVSYSRSLAFRLYHWPDNMWTRKQHLNDLSPYGRVIGPPLFGFLFETNKTPSKVSAGIHHHAEFSYVICYKLLTYQLSSFYSWNKKLAWIQIYHLQLFFHLSKHMTYPILAIILNLHLNNKCAVLNNNRSLHKINDGRLLWLFSQI